MSYESLKHYLEFNVKIHCEINVKEIFHETLCKKNFTFPFKAYCNPRNIVHAKGFFEIFCNLVIKRHKTRNVIINDPKKCYI